LSFTFNQKVFQAWNRLEKPQAACQKEFFDKLNLPPGHLPAAVFAAVY
jgi:hypothetical protein